MNCTICQLNSAWCSTTGIIKCFSTSGLHFSIREAKFLNILFDSFYFLYFPPQVVVVGCTETMAPLPVQITLVPMQMALTVSGVSGHPVEELWQLHSTRSALMTLETARTTIWNCMMVQMPAHHLLGHTVERYGLSFNAYYLPYYVTSRLP